jgi:CcmD family protein
MSYLFWAHLVCWGGVFIYVYSLIRKVSSLEKEIDALKGSFESSQKDNSD